MLRPLRRLADRQLQSDLAELQTRLREAESTIRVQGLELDALLGVIERDRLRVKAEASGFASTLASNEHQPRQRDE